MAGPITWRTINSNVDPAVTNLLKQGSESVNSAFDQLNKINQGMEQRAKDGYQADVKANTQAFLDQVRSQFTTPEQLEAARQSGALDKLRDQYGAKLNWDRTNAGAIDNLVGGLRDAAVKSYEYDKTKQAQSDQPILDGINTQILSMDDPTNADDLKAQIRGNTALSDNAKNEAIAQVSNRARTLLGQQRSDVKWDRNTKAYNEQELFKKESKNITSRVNDIIANADSFTQARAQLQAEQGNYQNAEVFNQAMNQLENAYKTQNGLSDSDMQELGAINQQVDIQTDSRIKQETAKTDALLSQLQIADVYSYNDKGSTSMGDVVAQGRSMGIDDNSLNKSLDSAIHDVLAGYNNSNIDADKKVFKLPNGEEVPLDVERMALEAIKGASVDEVIFGDKDFNKEGFKRLFNREMQRFIRTKTDLVRKVELENGLSSAVEELNQIRSSQKSAALNAKKFVNKQARDNARNQ